MAFDEYTSEVAAWAERGRRLKEVHRQLRSLDFEDMEFGGPGKTIWRCCWAVRIQPPHVIEWRLDSPDSQYTSWPSLIITISRSSSVLSMDAESI